jgi:hypothetical protein
MNVVGARSFRSPMPYTYKLNGTGLMGGTKDKQTTEYQAYKPQDQSQVAPTKFGYGGDNPVFGAISAYERMTYGMGLREQRNLDSSEDQQYDHALGVDASVYPWVKGPDVTTFTPATTDSTNDGTGFLKVGTTLYAIVGRYALQRVSDASWTVAQDFGSGKAAVDAVAFYSNALGAAAGLVAMGDSENFWYVTGGVWAQHASLKARAFGVAARELYRGHSVNAVTKCDLDADWTNAANWGNEYAFDVGDQSAGITKLPTTPDGALLVHKEDGRYAIQGANDDNPGYDRKLQDWIPDAANGKAVTRWGNELYVGTTYSGFWAISSDGGSHTQVGPELLTDGSNVVSGYITASKGTQFALYGALYSPDSGLTYVCKYLGMTERDGQRVPIWHGSLTQGYASQILAMETDTAGATTGHLRMYLAFANGDLGWWLLPCTPHPADCTAYRYTTVDGTLTLPAWTGGFRANDKALDAVTVMGRTLSSTNYARMATRSDPNGAFSFMSSNFDSGQREKVEFGSGASAAVLDMRLSLVNAANTSSPQVTGIGLHQQLHTPYRQVFDIFVLAEDNLLRRDGTPMPIGARRIASVVETACDTAGSITLVLPDESSKQVRVRNPREVTAWDVGAKRARKAFALECVEVTRNTVYGTHARMMAQGSHAALMNYTHGQLQAL